MLVSASFVWLLLARELNDICEVLFCCFGCTMFLNQRPAYRRVSGLFMSVQKITLLSLCSEALSRSGELQNVVGMLAAAEGCHSRKPSVSGQGPSSFLRRSA